MKKIGEAGAPGIAGKHGLSIRNEEGGANAVVLYWEWPHNCKHMVQTTQALAIHMDFTWWGTTHPFLSTPIVCPSLPLQTLLLVPLLPPPLLTTIPFVLLRPDPFYVLGPPRALTLYTKNTSFVTKVWLAFRKEKHLTFVFWEVIPFTSSELARFCEAKHTSCTFTFVRSKVTNHQDLANVVHMS